MPFYRSLFFLISVLTYGCAADSDNRPLLPEADVAVQDAEALSDMALPGPDASPCENVRCGPHGACVAGECDCESGYQSVGGVCVDVDECETQMDDCAEDALCRNSVGRFSCECAPGYSGDGRTCEDVHECNERLDNCSDNALCTNTDGGYECACRDGYVGDGIACVDDDECEAGTSGCHEQAECRNLSGSFECVCRPGWAGDGLECGDLDECAGGTDNCSDHGTCRNTAGGFECVCNPGWSGDGVVCADDDECALNAADCGERARCVNTSGSFECECDQGFEGDGRECFDIDECLSGVHQCDAWGMCVNRVGGYECVCPAGFENDGLRCRDVDECSAGSVCGLNSRCVNTPGAYECICEEGYFSLDGGCADLDECAMGLDDCHLFANCRNEPASFSCVCQPGFFGDGLECEDVDECQQGGVECQDNSSCVNQPGSYACLCDAGYRLEGDRCINIDECAEGTAGCSPEAVCTDEPGGFRCECNSGYQGNGFQCADIDECDDDSHDCPGELGCLNLPGSYQCGGEAFFVCDCRQGAAEGCVAGNNGHPGRRPDQPKRNLAGLEINALPRGASVRFCKGGSFIGPVTMQPGMACDQDAPCVLGAYQPIWSDGELAAPILNGPIVVRDAADGTSRGHLVLDSLEIRGMGVGAGVTLMSGTNDITMSALTVTGWEQGIVIGGSTNCVGLECPAPDRISLVDSTIVANLWSGIELVGDNVLVTRNVLRANGSDGADDHQVYIKCDHGLVCDGITVSHNNFRQTTGAVEPTCAASAVRVIGRTSDTRIENNDFRELADEVTSTCQGIMFDRAPSGEPTEFLRAVVANNVLVNAGVTAIGLSSCRDCLIENNLVSHDAPTYSIAIRAPVRRGVGEHALMEGLTVRNNSIYMGPQTRLTSISVFVRGDGGGHQIVSNAIVNLSQAGTTCCFDQSFDLSIYAAFDYNICQTSGDNARANWALGFGSLALWQAQSGYDSHSSDVDPGFIAPGPDQVNFRARNMLAPMVDSGDPALSSRRDYDGAVRVTPDIGAYEWMMP